MWKIVNDHVRRVGSPQLLPPGRIASFPDPYEYYIAHSGILIEFYGYRKHPNHQSVLQCCLHAYLEALDHWSPIESRLPLGTDVRSWGSNDQTTFLTLVPREEMTWAMLWATVPVLQWFSEVFDHSATCPQFQFLVMVNGIEGEVGYGQFTAE